MLNKIWAFMILCGILCAALTGNVGALSDAAIDGAGDAVNLCITMAGVVALWMGLMEIAKESGLVERMTKGIAPFLYYLFPRIPKGHPAFGYISTNVIANVLGLGWACTPAGLKAMEALADLERERGNPEYSEEPLQPQEASQSGGKEQTRPGETDVEEGVDKRLSQAKEKNVRAKKKDRTASTEMCTFLILNVSSLQLIPVNMIAYRRQFGSDNPARVILPALIATLISTAVAVLYCRAKERRER